jgi:predicted small secreted protein
MRRPLRVATTAASVIVCASMTACNSARAIGRVTSGDPMVARSSVVTGQEIAEGYYDSNLLDALQALRPRFLASRGPDGTRLPVVYVDGVRNLGGTAELRTIQTDHVSQVRYLSAAEANLRFGTGHTGGAIVVALRRPLDRLQR